MHTIKSLEKSNLNSELNTDPYTTTPSVTEIIGLRASGDKLVGEKSNALIIKFKTPMNVYNVCAADNYKFVESTLASTDGPLPIGTLATPLNNNSWIRFVLPTRSNYPVFEDIATIPAPVAGTPNNNYDIYIGYIGLDKIRYVCNTSGNIYPLCALQKITATVPLIDLSNGRVEITSDSTLVYSYTDGSTVSGKFYHNQFYNINKSDFIIGVSDQAINAPISNPLSIRGVSISQDGTSITFSFDSNTFTSAYKQAYISASDNNTIKDIFGKGIVEGSNFNGNVINSIPSTLIGISLTDISRSPTAKTINTTQIIGYPVEIALKFSNTIKNTSPSDFLIAFNNSINIPVNNAIISTIDSDTIIVEGIIPYMAIDKLVNTISIRTSADSPQLSTIDGNGNVINSFNYIPVNNILVSSANMNSAKTGDLDGASLRVVFNKDLDFSNNPLLEVSKGVTIKGAEFVIEEPIGTPQVQTPITKPYIDLEYTSGTDTLKLGRITLAKVDAAAAIFDGAATNTKFDITINQGSSNSELIITFAKSTATDVSKLLLSNLAYIEYAGQSVVFMDETKKLYVNTSLDYNAKATLK